MSGTAIRWCRGSLHAVALVFTAWSLVATSAPDPQVAPARDCFQGVSSPASLLVTLGPMVAVDGGAPSCGGIDGLAPDVALLFDVLQGDRPQEVQPQCYGFEITRLDGVSGVTLWAPASPTDGVFASAGGAFSSATQQACSGQWSVELGPNTPVPVDQLVSPFGAVPESWQLSRSINIPQAQFCGSAFATRGNVVCSDTFAVRSITVSGDP